MRGTLHIRVIGALEVMEDGELEEREELRETVIPIFEVVWRDLRRLLLPGGTAEFRRCFVTQALAFGNVHGLNDMLRENDVVISLAMHCWMNMFTFPPNGQHALAALLDPESSHPFMAPPNTLQKAVKAVTIDMIAVRLKEALSSEEMILWPLNYASPIWSLRMLPTELAHIRRSRLHRSGSCCCRVHSDAGYFSALSPSRLPPLPLSAFVSLCTVFSDRICPCSGQRFPRAVLRECFLNSRGFGSSFFPFAVSLL